MSECKDIERNYLVQFVGDFGILSNTAEAVCCEERAEEFARDQLLSHHGIDPLQHGFTDVRFEVLDECAI